MYLFSHSIRENKKEPAEQFTKICCDSDEFKLKINKCIASLKVKERIDFNSISKNTFGEFKQKFESMMVSRSDNRSRLLNAEIF